MLKGSTLGWTGFKEACPPGSRSGGGLDGGSFRRCARCWRTPRTRHDGAYQRGDGRTFTVAVVWCRFRVSRGVCVECLGALCAWKTAAARRQSCGSVQRLSAGENAGAAAAGRPACVVQVTDQQRLSRPRFCVNASFLSRLKPPSTLCLRLAVFSADYRAFWQPWPVPKKHGRSAESPSAARRASVQPAPLEGYGDSRGSSVATRKTSGRGNARSGTYRLQSPEKGCSLTSARWKKLFILWSREVVVRLRCATF